jgi:hypothetical protein
MNSASRGGFNAEWMTKNSAEHGTQYIVGMIISSVTLDHGDSVC